MISDPFELVKAVALSHASGTLDYLKETSPGDSEIERLFAFAIRAQCFLGSDPIERVMFVKTQEQVVDLQGSSDWNFSLIILPQAQLPNWRVDFLVYARAGVYELGGGGAWKAAIVECDGHDFHERTKEQAAKDRSRDRHHQIVGTPVFRFTGSELWRDPNRCARQVCQWAIKVHGEDA